MSVESALKGRDIRVRLNEEINRSNAGGTAQGFGISKESCLERARRVLEIEAAAPALGDALAIVLMEARGFRPEHFARFHPGGSLGRRLITRVGHVMHRENLPIVQPTDRASDVVQIISAGRMGVAVVCDGSDVAGVITDGDLRRAIERHRREFSELKACDMMTANPIRIGSDASLQDAVDLMTERSITSLIIAENGRLTGLVHLFDCTV